jgi:hypothetical protein
MMDTEDGYICAWCGEWLDETQATRCSVGDVHPDCLEDVQEYWDGTLAAHEELYGHEERQA